LKVLFQKGLLQRPIHDVLGAPRRGDDRALAHIWTDDEISLVFSSIDRDHPNGKRDYAILLMALRLAIRSSDIAKLSLDEIHWRRGEISFIQQKGGKPLSLPLPDDVAAALVDYLRYARPNTLLREIYLRQRAPYAPMRPSALTSIVGRYRRKAGLEKMPGCGMHSLRHTAATHLMTNSVRTEEISAILGHADIDTTLLYLRTSIPLLEQVGLDPDMEVSHA
jgi:integrase